MILGRQEASLSTRQIAIDSRWKLIMVTDFVTLTSTTLTMAARDQTKRWKEGVDGAKTEQ